MKFTEGRRYVLDNDESWYLSQKERDFAYKVVKALKQYTDPVPLTRIYDIICETSKKGLVTKYKLLYILTFFGMRGMVGLMYEDEGGEYLVWYRHDWKQRKKRVYE